MLSPAPSPPVRAIAAEELIVRLARALHQAGIPASRLEAAMEETASALGQEAGFFVTPTSVFVSFGRGAEQRTVLERVQPGAPNLERLVAIDAVAQQVARGELGVVEARSILDAIESARPRFGPGETVAAFVVATAGAVCFFGGRSVDLLASATVGLLVALLAVATGRQQRWARVYEAAAGYIAASLAALAAAWLGASPLVVTLASLIVLVPGLTLTTAMSELATLHLVSGTARLTGALMVLLMLGVGVALGARTAALLPPPAQPGGVPLPVWSVPLAACVVPLALVVLFRARPRDAGWIMAAGVLGFGGSRLAAEALGPELGTFVGGLLVGAGGNFYARRSGKPSAVATLPGIMLLVPGSLGFRSLLSVMDRNILGGVEAAYATANVAAALVAGLLMANVLLPSRKAL